MVDGERAHVRAAAEWAYGAEGSFSFPHVPPHAAMAYEVELLGREPAGETMPRGDMFFEERVRRAAELRAEVRCSFFLLVLLVSLG